MACLPCFLVWTVDLRLHYAEGCWHTVRSRPYRHVYPGDQTGPISTSSSVARHIGPMVRAWVPVQAMAEHRLCRLSSHAGWFDFLVVSWRTGQQTYIYSLERTAWGDGGNTNALILVEPVYMKNILQHTKELCSSLGLPHHSCIIWTSFSKWISVPLSEIQKYFKKRCSTT